MVEVTCQELIQMPATIFAVLFILICGMLIQASVAFYLERRVEKLERELDILYRRQENDVLDGVAEGITDSAWCDKP